MISMNRPTLTADQERALRTLAKLAATTAATIEVTPVALCAELGWEVTHLVQVLIELEALGMVATTGIPN